MVYGISRFLSVATEVKLEFILGDLEIFQKIIKLICEISKIPSYIIILYNKRTSKEVLYIITILL